MDRAGLTSHVLVTAVWIASLVLLVVAMAIYTGGVISNIEGDARKFYTQNVVAEEIMNAPCATASRAVFYKSSIVAGDFACTGPVEPVHVSFTLRGGPDQGTSYGWTIQPGDGPSTVVPFSDIVRQSAERYRVLVKTGGRTVPATMAVSAG
ncbi:MAG: hypothetical protein SVW77_02700 [Candidatus Nanohaloarchaea archaeon]|nr:hypothetical protein [Candidatus Nanohaloarchaea archaeon]